MSVLVILILAAVTSPARGELWKNNRDGTFTDVTEKAGVGYPGWGMGVATGDFDSDGWDDLYVTCFGANRSTVPAMGDHLRDRRRQPGDRRASELGAAIVRAGAHLTTRFALSISD